MSAKKPEEEKIRHDHKNGGNLILDKETGEVFCKICGKVDEECAILDQNVYNNDLDRENRRISSLRLYDKGLPTVIGSTHKDSTGRVLSANVKAQFDRLRMVDNRLKSQSSGAATKSFLLLDGIKSKLAIPEHTAEKAAYLFRKFLSGQTRHPRSHASMMLASLYAACRITNIPRTIQEISTTSNVKKRLILRDYRILVESLDLSFEPYKPAEFVARICTGLGLTEKTRLHATTILSKVKQDIFYGRNPIALAAAAVYISCKNNTERINQWRIASLVGISNVSLRNMYVLLKGNIA
ncbi:transcription initiation factor IIB [Candidatus Nitrosotenuis aquarius]|uniref:transcription initiation factor IIB n=1 Tax=Candidatus Nitrosotenuis aquarius TaxID=1846278 RepID=UPI000C1F92F2|nr:transcription initiation factor TFIIIB [Candidatus Nitrosotenuis aquarius]